MGLHSESSYPSAVPLRPNRAIVLVDGDDDFRSAFAANLRDDGYEVREYANPSELPDLGMLQGVGLLITDYEMSSQSGIRLADAFHTAHPQIPVVLTAGCWNAQVEAQAAARAYVQRRRKPIDYGEFLSLVRRLVSG